MSFEMKLNLNTKLDQRREMIKQERGTGDNFQMFLMVSKNLILFFRHKILNMLTKNPPFTKNMESPLCNEALVDQLWKLMNSGKAAVAFKVYYCNIFILVLKELWLFFFFVLFFF